MIRNGQKVSLEYSVYLSDGTRIDSNIGETPLTFVVGEHQVFPALEEAVKDLSIGDSKEVVLRAEEAYGPVFPDAFREVELTKIPPDFRFEGAVLGVQDPQGGVFPIRVHSIHEEKAILDFNHPLAGKDLRFELRLTGAN
ncbi:MAG TPA: FKBP-type peptidyl-prolyl cis-trans isomerase [Chlamydiales bacterium]|nr:FKBP-type peptidyl-prolyl cis-trans isomerase [Chlamydiales bacterium]